MNIKDKVIFASAFMAMLAFCTWATLELGAILSGAI